MRSGLAELVLEGSPFERGVRHGKHFAEKIRADALKFAKAASGPDPSRIRKAVDYLERLFPDIVEEIRGIAEGAGIGFEKVFVFNDRGLAGSSPTEGCSHVATVRDGKAIVGMNKDVAAPDPANYFVKQVVPDRGYAFLGYGHVGRVWGYGINQKGLCVAGTAAFARAKCGFPSFGLYFVGPVVLNTCATTGEAIDLVMGLESVSESGNILLADAGGSAAVVEVSARQKAVRQAVNGAVYSTNFFASGVIEDASDEEYLAETRARFERIAELICQFGSHGVDGMKRILSAHGDVGSVCRHGPQGERTVLSWIADAGARLFLIACGQPCAAEYVEYRFQQGD